MAYKMKGFGGFGNSPAKQEGPIDEQNPKLQKSEHPDTWVYPGKGTKGRNKSERIIDLEDRIEFINEDIFNQDTVTPQQKKDKAKLKQELAILRKSKH